MGTYRQPLLDQWGSAPGSDYRLPGTGENDVPATPGITHSWSSPGNIVNRTSSANLSSSGGTYLFPYLRASGFGFSIPTGATIEGVEARIRTEFGNSGDYTDDEVRLAWGSGASTLSAGDRANNAGVNSSTLYTYGDPTDLWGESTSTLTPAVVNSADFGAVLRLARSGGTFSRSMNVNYVEIAVYYAVAEDGAIRVTRAYAEALSTDVAPVRMTRVYAEVLRSIGESGGGGGGVLRRRRPVIVIGG